MSRQRRIAFWLFAAFSLFTLAGSPGVISTPDGTIMFRVSLCLLERGRADIQELESAPGLGIKTVPGQAGEPAKTYSYFGLGSSLAGIPGLGLGKLLLPLTAQRERGVFSSNPAVLVARPGGAVSPVQLRHLWYPTGAENFDEAFLAFAYTWANAFLCGLTVAGMFALGRLLGASIRAALILSLVSGLASPLWHYGRESFSEPLGAAGILWALVLAVRAGRSGRGFFLAGVALGIAGLARTNLFLTAVPFLGLVFWLEKGNGSRRTARSLLLSALGTGLGITAVAVYNAARFGSPFDSGYGKQMSGWVVPLFEGLNGLLLSPGRGLLWYCPVVLVAFLFSRRFVAASPAAGTFAIVSFLLQLILFARWHQWEGGWCWGPRFLIPVLPLLLLLALPAFEKGASMPGVTWSVVALSLWVSTSGVLVNYHDFIRWIQAVFYLNEPSFAAEGVREYYDLMRWDWEFSPLLRYWAFPAKDYFLFPHAMRAPGLVLGCLLAAATGCGLSVWRLVVALREGAGPRSA